MVEKIMYGFHAPSLSCIEHACICMLCSVLWMVITVCQPPPPRPAPSRNYQGKTISDFLQYINILMKANPTFKLSAMIRDLKSLTYTQEKIAF